MRPSLAIMTFCTVAMLAVSSCGRSEEDEKKANACVIDFDVSQPKGSDGHWTYTASVPTSCKTILTTGEGTISLALAAKGVEDTRYALEKAELDGQTEAVQFSSGLTMEGGSINLLGTQTPWQLPLESLPQKIRIVMVSADDSSPTNSIESLSVELAKPSASLAPTTFLPQEKLAE